MRVINQGKKDDTKTTLLLLKQSQAATATMGTIRLNNPTHTYTTAIHIFNLLSYIKYHTYQQFYGYRTNPIYISMT